MYSEKYGTWFLLYEPKQLHEYSNIHKLTELKEG